MAHRIKLRLYPSPNKGFQEVLTSPKAALCMYSVASKVSRAYAAEAPKQSGRLAASVRPSIAKSSLGRHKDRRWMARIRVTRYYAVWNITGAGVPLPDGGRHMKATGKRPKFGPYKGSFTFNKITKLRSAE